MFLRKPVLQGLLGRELAGQTQYRLKAIAKGYDAYDAALQGDPSMLQEAINLPESCPPDKAAEDTKVKDTKVKVP